MIMIDKILTYTATGVGALGTLLGILTTILKSVKASKKGQEAEQAKNMLSILEKAKEFIVEAEKHTTANGSLKKEIVIAKILNFARETNIKIDTEALSDMIDEIVALTRQVNKRSKDIYIV